MTRHKVEDIRNIALCGHGGAGKTTLADKMLTVTRTVTRPASVDDGTSVCDFDEVAKAHHYSIESAVVHFEYAGKHFNVIDTPGYPDFIGQAIGALRAVETAAIIINAHAGIEVNTRRMFHEAGKAGCGRVIVINKMDSDNIEFAELIGSIQALFGKACIPLNVPIGSGRDFKGVASTLKVAGPVPGALLDPLEINKRLIESIVEVDEEVMSHYFEGTLPTDEELPRLIDEAIVQGSLIPVVCVAEKTEIGLTELLDVFALCDLPPDKVVRKALNEAGEEVVLAPDPAGPLCAQVFKTRIDPFVQKVSYLRVYSGTLKKDDNVHVSGRGRTSRSARCWKFRGAKRSRSSRPGLAISSPSPRPKTCTPARRSATSPCRPSNSRRPWSGWPPLPRAAATRRSFPAPCTRSWRKTPRCGSTAIRKPRNS